MEAFIPRQTNTGLYVQMHAAGFTPDELKVTQHAYRLACRLFNGRYRKTERAFICHAVGVASAAACFDSRISVVLAAMLHAAYDSGLFPDGRTGPFSEKSIAVLPFTTRSEIENDRFFSDGMHDDLLTQLAKIGELKVISRTSVMEYRDTTKNLREIGTELGVASIMEGAIQRSGKQVRINVQLIDAQTDEHLWAEIYDRELTAENLFAIQTEIAKAIAGALHATLSPAEQQRIEQSVLTDNLEALQAYQRSRLLAADGLEEETLKRRP